ncbi:unnamed protein product [Lasius platythorax]|uniref:Uncharacterized protein n=1 Tax=Lasius platythorax TaxID=488582 RepID=A0AAV2NMZ7_9HYME
MKRQKNFLLLSTRQKNRRIALHVNNDLLSCQQSTSNNNGDNNSKSAADTIINNNDQRSDFSDLDSISSLHSSSAEENIERAFEEAAGYESHNASDSDNLLNFCNDDEEALVESELRKNIRDWSIKYLIFHNAINSLLAIVRSAGHADLPKDARTLLCTPKMGHIQEMSWGQYVHYGLEKAVIDNFKTVPKAKRPQEILIDVHVDGISISKSSKQQLWTILGKIHSPHFGTPFFIGAHALYGKPKSAAEYLHNFCEEYSRLSKEGFIF